MSLAVSAVCRELGVSRVARLTGLDRCGVEVASAVRPAGHVLQVSQGKGRTWSAAVWSALGEAAELTAAETPPEHFTWRGGAFVDAAVLGSRETVKVPAEAVWCPPGGQVWFGVARHEWTSNGLAAHTRRSAAVEHGALELVERDAVARALPEGFTADVRARLLDMRAPLVHALERRGFEVFVFDLTPARGRLPVVGALLFDRERGPIPLTAGYACRRSPEAAAEAALLEAAQSRLTEVHGAREDVVVGDRESGARLRGRLQRATKRRGLATLPRAPRRPLHQVVSAELAVVELAIRPLVVVRVLSDQLLRSALL